MPRLPPPPWRAEDAFVAGAIAMMVLGACKPPLGSIPTEPPTRHDAMHDAMVDAVREAGEPDGAGPDAGGGDQGLHDAGGGHRGPHDAGGADSEDASQAALVRHASCEAARPLDYAEPVLTTDATGRPLFDMFRDFSCDEVAAFSLCGPGEEGCVGMAEDCLRIGTGLGVCIGGVEEEAYTGFTFNDGRCYVSESAQTKQRACCAQVPGVDCRPWPYDGKSKAGELCARHADCEPGLLCKPNLGVAQCTCPEASPREGPCFDR